MANINRNNGPTVFQNPPSPPLPPPSAYFSSSSPKFIRSNFVTSVCQGNSSALQSALTTLQRLLSVDKKIELLNRKFPEFGDHTALYVAVTKNYPECCKILVDTGANTQLDSVYVLAKKKGGELFAAVEPRLVGKLLDVGECSICEEVTSLYPFECGHILCYDCSGKWAKECALSLTPKCPQLNCPIPVHVNVFKNLLTSSDFDAYITTLVRTALSASDMFVWCPNCPSGIFLDNLACSSTSCPDCKTVWCATCKLPAHSEISCEEAKIRQGLYELENDVWRAKNAKQCPQCKVHIQKNQGCSHITCRQCKYQFCWICLGKYQPGKHTFGDTCPCVK